MQINSVLYANYYLVERPHQISNQFGFKELEYTHT
jgi:hypothetical protein